jgi:REP element-mobilizing transposase RayT
VDERKSVVTGAPGMRNNSAVFERVIDVTQKRIACYVLHVTSILNGIVFEWMWEFVENSKAPRLREVRSKHGFSLVGFVIMPEHVHLLISEAPGVTPAKVIQVFKQRVSRRMRGKRRTPKNQLALRFREPHGELRRFWQRRYYDFNIYSRKKLWEKLDYMHANPVEKRLVEHPRDWPWSSWSFYATGDGILPIDPL